MNNTYISTILIVDDTRANIIALKALLEDDNINIVEANSGNEALKKVLTNKIDLVLLDVQMPDMNGFEVAEILRSNNKTKSIPLIFITAISKKEEYIFRGFELGAVDYLYKPIKNELLKSKVKVFLRLNKQARIIEDKNMELLKLIEELKEKEEKISRLVNLDGLTGINNRRSFDEKFEKEWYRCLRNEKEVSLLLMDIDFFKRYNDTYGHLAGDDCLIKVAKEMVKSVARSYDEVFRYGGEEFVVLLPETHHSGAMVIAEKIRKNIENLNIEYNNANIADHVTISLGVSTCIPKNGIDRMSFFDIVDKKLYEAKNNGRNKVVG